MRARLDQIVVDCEEPARLVRFWAGLLGGEPVNRAMGWSHVEHPGFVRLAFQPVPKAKSVKDRLHLDIEVDYTPAAVIRAVDLGAVVVSELTVDEQGGFQVLRDPAGNEFCLVQPAPDRE